MGWTFYNASGQRLSSAAAASPSQADQAALEAETDEDTYAPPDLIKHSPGVAKAWVDLDGTGTVTADNNYNTAVSDNGVGDYRLTWGNDFASAHYVMVAMAQESAAGSTYSVGVQAGTRACDHVYIAVRNNSDATVDADPVMVAAFGELA